MDEDCSPRPDCPHGGRPEEATSCGDRCECEARRREALGRSPGEKLFDGLLWLGLGVLILGLAVLFARLAG